MRGVQKRPFRLQYSTGRRFPTHAKFRYRLFHRAPVKSVKSVKLRWVVGPSVKLGSLPGPPSKPVKWPSKPAAAR
eukprot:1502890-Prymnesium_polylepis.1